MPGSALAQDMMVASQRLTATNRSNGFLALKLRLFQHTKSRTCIVLTLDLVMKSGIAGLSMPQHHPMAFSKCYRHSEATSCGRSFLCGTLRGKVCFRPHLPNEPRAVGDLQERVPLRATSPHRHAGCFALRCESVVCGPLLAPSHRVLEKDHVRRHANRPVNKLKDHRLVKNDFEDAGWGNAPNGFRTCGCPMRPAVPEPGRHPGAVRLLPRPPRWAQPLLPRRLVL